MNTIIISAIVAAIIGAIILILWKTKGFKKLREKNRATEIKEEKTVGIQHYKDKPPEGSNQPITNFENGLPPNSSNYHATPFIASNNQQFYIPTVPFTENSASFSTTETVTPNIKIESIPIENPPKVRVEIKQCYDHIKATIENFDVEYISELGVTFSINPKNDLAKNIVVQNDTIYVGDLDTKFQLLTSETALFNNLAKEESERRAIEASAITHEKLKKFAERLPKVEKVVGVKAAVKKTAPVKKVAKGKVK